MKKHRKILTAALFAVCMGTLPIQAIPCSVPVVTANAETEDTIEYNSMTFEIREDKPNELILTSYSGEEADLTVPETISGKTVTGIANGTFVGNQIIKNVILPDTIDYFGNCVFFDCSLETINIPKSLRVIPNQTFQNCKNLKSVEFHDNILCIAKTAFYNCPLELPENLKDKCINRKIFTSETVEYEDMIFAVSKENVDELILISYNENEENLIIPETIDDKDVTAIMGNLFKGNKKIKNITLPDTVYYLETGTFADSSVETINIPKMLIIIPDYTFKNCTNLKSVAFHDKVIFVSKNAFENTSVNVPNHINSELTFENSAKYHYEYENFNIRIYLDENNDYSVGLLSTKIPKEKAQNMVLPETIYGLPVTAFNYPDRNNQGDGFSRYSSVCGYDENGNWYGYSIYDIWNMSNQNIGINSVEFPKYFNNINTSAFQNHTELKEIIINSTDVKITDNAFENTGIERLEIHNPKQIGKSSFAGCTELKNITFDECSGDLLIDKNAFSGCENLQTLTIEGNPETLTINDYAFKNCNSLEKITIPKTCKNLVIGRSALKDTQIKEVEIDEDCTIGIDAFAGCPLESVIINSDSAEIKLGAFDNCKNLKELKLSKGCNLSANSFMNCTALENINIDTSGKVFGNAFNGCENLVSINGEQVFDSKTGDFKPKYKDFIMQNFNGSDDVGFINQYVQAQVKKIVAENITPDMNDMQKVRTLHDWVCEHTKYSYSDEPNYDDSKNHSDASILMNNSTVCEGYTKLCNLLYHEAGLETYYQAGVNHAWNIVKIDGHYFHVDTTWDDSSASYNWFCKSDSEMKNAGGSHASWKTATSSTLSVLHDFQENITPECPYSMGDINTDGEVNIADTVKLENYLLGKEQPDENLVLSDLNFDGITDVFDMIEMRKKVTE